MRCTVCRQGETQPGTTTVAFHRGGRTLVVNEVPAEVCENCAEAYVHEVTTDRLLQMAADADRHRVTVCVCDYEPSAA